MTRHTRKVSLMMILFVGLLIGGNRWIVPNAAAEDAGTKRLPDGTDVPVIAQDEGGEEFDFGDEDEGEGEAEEEGADDFLPDVDDDDAAVGIEDSSLDGQEGGDSAIDETPAEAPPGEAFMPVDDVREDLRSPEEIEEDEIVRRQEREILAQEAYITGREYYLKGEYEEAVSKFIAAQLKLKEASATKYQDKQELLDRILAATYEEWADQIAQDAHHMVEVGMFDDAIDTYRKVLEKDPKRKEIIDARVAQLMQSKEKAEFKAATAPNEVDPEYSIRNREIDELLEKGKVFFRNSRYTDARENFEQVLLKDPYHKPATKMLRLVNERLEQAANERRTIMKQERLAEVGWKWTDPVTPLVSPTVTPDDTRPVAKAIEGEGIRWKLENIIIPKIVFQEATIHDLVKYLKGRSKELDPDNEGVNIFLQLQSSGAGAEPTDEFEDDFGGSFDDFGEQELDFLAPTGDVASPKDFDDDLYAGDDTLEDPVYLVPVEERTISLDFDNIPLGEAIRYICQGAGLKYRVERHAIIIASQNVPFDDMETRFYPVEAGFMAQQATRERGIGFEDDDDDDDDDEIDPVKFFYELGVEFPQGARVKYDQRTSKLIVTNTPNNLRKVEKLLTELNVSPTQVTIEAKFIEISQLDLQELGFEWILQGNPTGDLDAATSTTTDLILGTGGNQSLKIHKQLPTDDVRLGSGIRHLPEALGQASGADGRLLTIEGILGDVQARTILHALAQKSSADILSAPKVTTLSGETAVIKMVTERFFPEQWTEPEFQAGTSTAGTTSGPSITPSIPEFGTASEIGVIMQVTPTVASDGYSIDLDLEPEVVQFLGFDDYSYTTLLQGTPIVATLQMPIFSRRSVSTKVIVWDGETVVLGGMITEDVMTVTDKIPFLGDLPLLGKLFQSNIERREKRNLIIFVSARLVNPAGLPIRTADIRGLPDFRR